jgi:hypothetical protein
MDIIWKYKIDVKDQNVFSEIEKERGVVFPEELREFIIENNGSTPSRYNFMLKTQEKVFGAVLSFNRDETDVDSVFTALRSVEEKNLMPFAIDPFGNYICYSFCDGKIVFWNHETESTVSTGRSLCEFIESLY